MLALQGAYAAHQRALGLLGVESVPVRRPEHLAGIAAIVMPGGESTTMSRLLETSGLFDPVARLLAEGMPAFGTCAGAILLGSETLDGRADQRNFGAIDLAVRRNGYGRQVDSFEEFVQLVDGVSDDPAPFPAIFIRAPRIERVGEGVEVLAELDGDPVLCRAGAVLVATFHPELAGDLRLHELFCRA